MSKASSGLFSMTAGARISYGFHEEYSKRASSSGKPVDPNNIRFSQISVNGSGEIIRSMKEHGWQGSPIDVVIMDDGKMTALDNTRVIAARVAGIDVMANVHGYNEPLPGLATRERFTTPRGGMPLTWGQAVENRIGKQSSKFRRDNPRGSYNIGKVNKGE